MQKNYWEIERLALENASFGKSAKEAVAENVNTLLKIYFTLKNYLAMGYGRVKAIDDVELRYVCPLTFFSYLHFICKAKIEIHVNLTCTYEGKKTSLCSSKNIYVEKHSQILFFLYF